MTEEEFTTATLDAFYMAAALESAREALKRGEVPIGAIILNHKKNKSVIIAKAYNKREKTQNALDHAELLAIKKACHKLKSWRLDNCTMYVTLQPCVMCAGAILNARIPRLVIGARSDRTNYLDIYQNNNLNHKTQVEILDMPECSDILKHFFSGMRN